MRGPDRFRDAATVRVNAPPDRVRELVSDPNVLQALDDRLTGRELQVRTEGDRVEIWSEGDRLRLAFRVSPDEEDSTRLAALEQVKPVGVIEQTKRMLFPGQAHRDLEAELDRFRRLVEGFEPANKD